MQTGFGVLFSSCYSIPITPKAIVETMAQPVDNGEVQRLQAWIASETGSNKVLESAASLCSPDFDPTLNFNDERWKTQSSPVYRYLLFLENVSRYYELTGKPMPTAYDSHVAIVGGSSFTG